MCKAECQGDLIRIDEFEEYEEFMSISSLLVYLKENPSLEQLVNGFPGIGDTIRLGMKKPDNGFREILRRIKKGNGKGFSRSSINTFD